MSTVVVRMKLLFAPGAKVKSCFIVDGSFLVITGSRVLFLSRLAVKQLGFPVAQLDTFGLCLLELA